MPDRTEARLSFDAFLDARGADRRLARLTHDIILPKARGLEFGPGDSPTPLPDTVAVEYVDHRAEASSSVGIDWIWSGSGPLTEACEGRGYDFAIAAQVLQYVPNLCGWMRGVFDILRPGGVLNLALPDKRFIFDARRKVSTLGEVLEADLHTLHRPSPRQIFDHTHDAVAIEPGGPWDGEADLSRVERLCGPPALALAYDQTMRAWRTGSYESCHCWVFTPLSFLDLIARMTELGLTSFVISQFATTDRGGFEFFASLRRDTEADPAVLLHRQRAALDHVRQAAVSVDAALGARMA